MAVMGSLSMVEKAGFPVLIPALSKRGVPSRNRARKGMIWALIGS